MILELKRRIEIARAALNREQSISEEEVDEQIKKEYQEFHQKVDEEYQKSKKSQEEQAQKEEKRKFYEEQWKKQHGESADGAEDIGIKTKKNPPRTSQEPSAISQDPLFPLADRKSEKPFHPFFHL